MAKIKKIKLPNDETTYELEGTVTDISDTTSSIDAITTDYPDIATNDVTSTLFGKIKKFLSDLKSNKQDKITGGATTIVSNNLTASRALVSNSSGKVAVSAVTSTELGYLDGVTSKIQTQLNAKAPKSDPIFTGAVSVGSTSNNGSIEMYHSTPYIDFHYNKSTSDYTSRLIESASGTLTCSKNFSVGGTLAVTGQLTASGVLKVVGYILNTGTLALRTANGATVVNTDNSAHKPIAASAFNVGSSKLIKKNIKELSNNEAKKILDINVVSFDYKAKFGGTKNQRGVIAEEVLDIIPCVVNVPDGYDESNFKESSGINQDILSVDYSKFVPYLIKMVQIQQKEIDELKDRIVALKELIEY